MDDLSKLSDGEINSRVAKAMGYCFCEGQSAKGKHYFVSHNLQAVWLYDGEDCNGTIFLPATRIGDAWPLVEEIDKDNHIDLAIHTRSELRDHCTVSVCSVVSQYWPRQCSFDEIPRAISEAFLMWKGTEVAG